MAFTKDAICYIAGFVYITKLESVSSELVLIRIIWVTRLYYFINVRNLANIRDCSVPFIWLNLHTIKCCKDRFKILPHKIT